MATQAHAVKHPKKKQHFTMLFVLQMFSAALIISVCLISAFIVVLRMRYDVTPGFEEYGFVATSPIYAAFGASVCLVLSFLLPEYIIETARQNLKHESPREQTEDMPFVLVPSIFIRYGLLSIVTIVSFVISSAGRGVTIFVPLGVASIALMIAYFPTEHKMRSWLDNDHKLHLT